MGKRTSIRNLQIIAALANYRILYGSGYIIGTIISGYLLQAGFSYVAGLAAFLTLLNIILLLYVDSRQDCQCATKSYEKLEETLKDYLEELQASILGTHWYVLVQKYLFSCGVLIFFSKLRYLLLRNCDIDSITLGYTEAYVNGLELACMCYISEPLTQALRIYPSTFVSEILLFLLTVFSALACYAPNYNVFMLLLIPLVVLRSTIQRTWEESLGGVAVGLTAPFVFGILANQTALTHLVVVLSTCIPLMLCWPGHQHIDGHEDQAHNHEDYEHDDG
ncbi:hypothetical protein HUJ04_011887 [Dendroctonus ponderosae]|nr:hypothetical protein HUJ04_011887 [Dendroctonus ponderosae]